MMQRALLLARRHDRRVGTAMMRDSPGRPRRVGDGEPRTEAEPAEAAIEIGKEPRFAAEEMRRAFDLEKQAVGAIRLIPDHDERRIAEAPQAKPLERRRIGRGVGVTYLQVEDFRARIRQKLALDEAASYGRFIERGEARPALTRSDEGDGPAGVERFSRRAARRPGGSPRLVPQEARDRPGLEPDGNDARHDPTR